MFWILRFEWKLSSDRARNLRLTDEAGNFLFFRARFPVFRGFSSLNSLNFSLSERALKSNESFPLSTRHCSMQQMSLSGRINLLGVSSLCLLTISINRNTSNVSVRGDRNSKPETLLFPNEVLFWLIAIGLPVDIHLQLPSIYETIHRALARNLIVPKAMNRRNGFDMRPTIQFVFR